MDDPQRFLDLVRRELDCHDAYFQLGGEAPDTPRTLAVEISERWRVVAVLPTSADAAPDTEALTAKLRALVLSFSSLPSTLRTRKPSLASPQTRDEVDEALALLARQAKALRAVVIDEDSPVLWGSSELPHGQEDVEAAMWIGELADSAAAAELDLVELVQLEPAALETALETLDSPKLRQRLLRKLPRIRELGSQRDAEAWAAHFTSCRAIAALRRAPERHEAMRDDLGWIARDFAGIYHVLLIYPGPFSELDAARPLLKALPAIEKLVLALPPVEPPPRANARVLSFKR